MRWSVIGLLCTGVVAAFCAAILVAVGLGGAGAAQARQTVKTVEIVVAKRDLPHSTVVTEEMIERVTLPESDLPKRYLRQAQQVIGQTLISNVQAQQAFTPGSFVENTPGAIVASMLEEGMRAVSVKLEDDAGLRSLLFPSCIVDVVVAFPLNSSTGSRAANASKTILQNIRVLAIADKTIADIDEEEAEGGSPKRSATSRYIEVTLELTAKQAETMKIAMEVGQVSLAMRNPQDKKHIDTVGMVLDKGESIEFDSFLDSQRREAQVKQTENETTAKPAPVVQKPQPAPKWEVRIIRGSEVETQTLNDDRKETEGRRADSTSEDASPSPERDAPEVQID